MNYGLWLVNSWLPMMMIIVDMDEFMVDTGGFINGQWLDVVLILIRV